MSFVAGEDDYSGSKGHSSILIHAKQRTFAALAVLI
jgi:hypothetical protein